MQPRTAVPHFAAHAHYGDAIARSAGVYFDNPEIPGITFPGQTRSASVQDEPADPAPSPEPAPRAPDVIVRTAQPEPERQTANDARSEQGVELGAALAGINETLQRMDARQTQLERELRGEAPMPTGGVDDEGRYHDAPTREDLQRAAERNSRERDEVRRAQEIAQRDLQRVAGLQGMDRDAVQNFSLVRAAAISRFGVDNADIRRMGWQETDIIAEHNRSMRRDALGIGSPQLGGVLLPVEVNQSVGDRLAPRTVVRQLGATFLPMGTTYDMVFPQKETTGRAHWVGSEKKATESNMTLSSYRLTAKPLVATMPITDDGIFFTNGRLQQMADDDLFDQHAEAMDSAVFAGQGAAGEPLGIANTPQVQQIDWGAITGGNADEASLASFAGADQRITKALKAHKYALQTANALRAGARTAFAGNPALFEIFDEEARDADGKPLFNETAMPNLVTGTAQTLSSDGMGSFYGARAGATTLIDFGGLGSGAFEDLYYGDFSQVVIGQFGGIEMRVTDSHDDDFDYGRLRIRMKQRVDAVLRRGQYFTISQNLKLVA